ncbi:MAG: OstA-like protein [Cytophagales bacterium]|nr:MAG: hypothetical protein CND83_04405 [Rhodothermaeota bacterium MED-G19]
MKKIFFSFILLTFISANLFSQKKEKVSYKADELKFKRINKEPVRKLKNNVIFNQGGTEIKCDSANFYNKRNILEAFGKILITNSDSSTIVAEKLIYDGESKTAKLRDNVIYKKGNEQVKTNNLDYYIDIKMGIFFENGELKDEINILSSQNGVFYGDKDLSIFYNDVKLIGENYILKSDSMTYNSVSKEAITFGFTEIKSEDSVMIESMGGVFKQESNYSKLSSSKIETDQYILEGDIINYDEENSIYYASKNVKLKIKESDYYVFGDEGIYFKESNKTKIFGNTLLKKIIENDTFYLSSDTILAVDENNEIKNLYAYNNVQFYKENFIGKSDSILFNINDSLIKMFNDPIVWNLNNQMTSDTITFKLISNKVEEMNLLKNSFIISKDSLGNFNQIKGRNMLATFLDDNYLNSINVNGNGETIYFGLNEESNSILGLNYIVCSDLKLNFKNNDLNNIIFYKNPIAKMIPPHEIKEEDLYIKSFHWREEDKPKISDVVYYFRKKIYLRDDSKTEN